MTLHREATHVSKKYTTIYNDLYPTEETVQQTLRRRAEKAKQFAVEARRNGSLFQQLYQRARDMFLLDD
jgi:hypothetical protein